MSEALSAATVRSRFHRHRPVRWLCLLWLLAVASSLSAFAQTARPAEPEPGLRVQAYTLRHQAARDAIELVSPFLSERGSIELQPIGNTVVVRDELGRIARILPVLRAFDHPRRAIRVEVRIVRASIHEIAQVSNSPQLSDVLTQRLRDLLRFQHYDLVASTDLTSMEGDPVLYEVGGDYQLQLRLGTVLATNRLKLNDFQLSKAAEEEGWSPLIHTNLEVTLGDPMVLGLAPFESSEQALMLVVTCHPAAEPEPGLRAE